MKNEESAEILMDKLRHRFAKGFLDLLILQLVEAKPTWGYDIIKKTETTYKIKLRHGALYPMLNKLNAKGLITCRKELQKGRVRKIYEITNDGKLLLHAYYLFLMEQMPKKTTDESQETRK
jgi:PadR family transcriptional regulator PadR